MIQSSVLSGEFEDSFVDRRVVVVLAAQLDGTSSKGSWRDHHITPASDLSYLGRDGSDRRGNVSGEV